MTTSVNGMEILVDNLSAKYTKDMQNVWGCQTDFYQQYTTFHQYWKLKGGFGEGDRPFTRGWPWHYTTGQTPSKCLRHLAACVKDSSNRSTLVLGEKTLWSYWLQVSYGNKTKQKFWSYFSKTIPLNNTLGFTYKKKSSD